MDDAERLLAWRNDPETRANSIATDEVDRTSHLDWLGRSLQNPDRKLLIAEVDGKAVGTLRIDDGRELSWTVAPEHRGKGVGRIMVAEAARSGHTAQIKRHNIASQKIAAAVGFELVKDGELQEWVKR